MDILNRVNGGNVGLVTDYEVTTKKTYRECGTLKKVTTFLNGAIHSIDGEPGVVEYTKDGYKLNEKWYNQNKLHNENGPSAIYYNMNSCNIPVTINRHLHGKLHSVGMKPGNETFQVIDGKQVRKGYVHYNNGEIHSWNGEPAEVHFTPSGEIQMKVWQQNGKLHNMRGPAVIALPFEDNQIEEPIYGHFKNGVELLGEHADALNHVMDDPDAYEFAMEMIDEKRQ